MDAVNTALNRLAEEARGIRRRVAGASTKTQNAMRSEAAALEHAVLTIRAALDEGKTG